MMNPILKRTVAGLSVGGIVIVLFLYCPLRWLMPLVLALSSLAQMEFYAMAKRRYEPVAWFGLLMGALWIAAVGIVGFGKGVIALAAFFAPALLAAFFLLCIYVLFSPRFTRPLGAVAVTLAGFLYVPFLLSSFLLLSQLTGDGLWGGEVWISRTGLYTLFALIVVSKFSDTGGFAFGMAFGKHKMCPAISPKKSWEGLVGSMVFAACAASVMLAISRHYGWGADLRFWAALSYPVAAAAGAALALAATACDLIESRFKREFDVKDSSVFLPAGMGGLLDMFDSVLFLPAFAFVLIFLFGA